MDAFDVKFISSEDECDEMLTRSSKDKISSTGASGCFNILEKRFSQWFLNNFH
uniref:Uncharacterized protein n=1 Tax=Solanum lycopersicum TaxID=4081 RepID=A0A3Q7IWR1_SOLLC